MGIVIPELTPRQEAEAVLEADQQAERLPRK